MGCRWAGGTCNRRAQIRLSWRIGEAGRHPEGVVRLRRLRRGRGVTGSLPRGFAWGLAAFRGFGQPGVQSFPDFIRGIGTAAALVADDHGAGRDYAGEGGQTQHLVPVHLLRLERACREYQFGPGRRSGPHG